MNSNMLKLNKDKKIFRLDYGSALLYNIHLSLHLPLSLSLSLSDKLSTASAELCCMFRAMQSQKGKQITNFVLVKHNYYY